MRSPSTAKDTVRPSRLPAASAPLPDRLRPARGVMFAMAGGAAVWAMLAAAWFLL